MLVILIRFPADTKQLPYDYATFCIWGAVEVNIAVVSGTSYIPTPHSRALRIHTPEIGCCPFLRPVIQYICPSVLPRAWSSRQITIPSRSVVRLATVLTNKRNRANGASDPAPNVAEADIVFLADHDCATSPRARTLTASDSESSLRSDATMRLDRGKMCGGGDTAIGMDLV